MKIYKQQLYLFTHIDNSVVEWCVMIPLQLIPWIISLEEDSHSLNVTIYQFITLEVFIIFTPQWNGYIDLIRRDAIRVLTPRMRRGFGDNNVLNQQINFMFTLLDRIVGRNLDICC